MLSGMAGLSHITFPSHIFSIIYEKQILNSSRVHLPLSLLGQDASVQPLLYRDFILYRREEISAYCSLDHSPHGMITGKGLVSLIWSNKL